MVYFAYRAEGIVIGLYTYVWPHNIGLYTRATRKIKNQSIIAYYYKRCIVCLLRAGI